MDYSLYLAKLRRGANSIQALPRAETPHGGKENFIYSENN